MNPKGCSFLLAVFVVVVGLGLGYGKFRAQQRKVLRDTRIAQWHGPLLAMLGHPPHVSFRNQTFSVSGFLCGEFAEAAASTVPHFQRFVVSPDHVVVVGARAYTSSGDELARRQWRDDQARLDQLTARGATPEHAFDAVAWDPHCQ